MPIIKITDVDFTTPGTEAFDYDIAYVPGFTIKSDAPEQPTLCRTVHDFERVFGSCPAQFTQSVTIQDSSDTQVTHTIPAGAYDIGYMYAKELIANGISIYYHALQKITPHDEISFELIASEPDGWSEGTYKDYYQLDDNATSDTDSDDLYIHVQPAVGYVAVTADDEYQKDTYYVEDNGKYVLIRTRKAPSDWKTASDKYFKEVESAPTFEQDTYYEATANGSQVNTINMPAFYTSLITAMNEITAVNEYNIKYITSGGYPVYKIANSPMGAMLQAASQFNAGEINSGRGDCIALIDHIPSTTRVHQGDGSLIAQVRSDTFSNGQFGAMFTDWAYYSRNTSDYVIKESTGTDYFNDNESITISNRVPIDYTNIYDGEDMNTAASQYYNAGFLFPGSFAYLKCVGNQLATGNSWLAVAGVQRGIIPNYIKSYNTNSITNKIADYVLQDRTDISINPITFINGYGTCIWGNRTLYAPKGNLVASNFLNIRSMLCDLKKVCYRTAKRNTFEQDSDILWINFTQPIKALLEQMKTSYCISNYKIIRKDVDDNAKLGCTIKIYPLYAIEDFDIDIELYDSEANISE